VTDALLRGASRQASLPVQYGGRPQTKAHASGWAPLLGVLGTFAAVTAAVSVFFWPGQIDPDTLDELHEAAVGHFADWHTPLLSALWRGPYLLGFTSPGWVLAACIMTFLAGLYLLLRVRFGRVVSTAVAVLLLAWPPILSWTVHVGRDTWFIAFLLFAFGSLARLVRMGPIQRGANLTAVLVSAFLCYAAWQIALIPLLALFAVTATQLLPRGLRYRTLLVGAIAVASCLVLFAFEGGLQRAIGTKATYPEQATFVYDLGQLSKSEGTVLYPKDVLFPHRDTLRYIEDTVKPGTLAQLYGRTAIVENFLTGRPESDLERAWIGALWHHPFAYLEERSELALEQFSVTNPSFWTFQPPPSGRQFRPLTPALQQYGLDYLMPFSSGGNLYGDVLYSVWFYLLLAAVSVPVLVRRGGVGDRALAGFGVAILLLAVAVFFTAPELVYRFTYPIVVGGAVLLPTMLPRPRSARATAGSCSGLSVRRLPAGPVNPLG
jgi:hypothetical protein